MANYSSHIILAEKVYKNLKNKDIVDKDLMKLFSFGQDLTFLNRSYFKETHTVNSRNFFINTIKYIKDNNLQNNKLIMSYLYGHISHYAFDITIHPFVGTILNEIKPKSLIKPHTYLECEMDKYLIKKYGDIDFSFMKSEYMNDKTLRNMINTTYRNVYGFFNVSHLYKAFIFLIRRCKCPINKLYNNKCLFIKLSRINSYDSNSNFSKYVSSSKLLQKYNMNSIFKSSIKLSISMIKSTNDYLYKNKDINVLYNTFDDTPYDIGVIKNVEYNYNKIPLKYNLPLQIK